jgi:hypothetical protein
MMAKIKRLFDVFNTGRPSPNLVGSKMTDKSPVQDLRSIQLELHALDHLIDEHLNPQKHMFQKFSDHEKDH